MQSHTLSKDLPQLIPKASITPASRFSSKSARHDYQRKTLKPLTPKQREVFDFILAQRKLGKSPSLHQIQQWFELSSRSHAKHFVTELAQKGWITYAPNVPYSIEVKE